MKLLGVVLLGLGMSQSIPQDGTGDALRKKKNGYSSYGDPHFSIAPAGRLPLCFDINPHENVSMLNFLIDPITSLAVTGTTEPSSEMKGRTFISQVHFSSPEGIRIEFDQNGVKRVASSGLTEKLEGQGSIGDIEYKEHLSKDGSHERTVISIQSGPSFELMERFGPGSYSVKVTDQSGISSKARGVFGAFMDPDFYKIIPDGGTYATTGSVVTGRRSIPAVRKNFHHTDDCWVISQEDALNMIN